MFQQITTCAACHGRGSIIEQPCTECHGTGEVERDETLTVTIPVGVEEGTALRIPGHGLPSREHGGTPGDLFVVVRSAPDPRFERHGADLWRSETLEIPDAVLGTELAVPTLDDPITVTVKAGTQPGTVLRLHGKGLPVFGGSGRGELYVRVQVRVPEHVSREERKLYGRLRALRK
jgi:molecular chaperone DnaJ